MISRDRSFGSMQRAKAYQLARLGRFNAACNTSTLLHWHLAPSMHPARRVTASWAPAVGGSGSENSEGIGEVGRKPRPGGLPQ